MTQNQIAYWSLKENERSHKAQEKETNRANLAKEGQLALNANRQWFLDQVNLGRQKYLDKQQRENTLRTLAETERSNKANEAIRSQSNTNAAREIVLRERQQKEVERSNLESERNKRETLAEQRRLNTNNYLLELSRQGETSKHNRAQEIMNNLSIQETNRANRAHEEAQRFSNITARINAEEQARSNKARELETAAHNRNSEYINLASIYANLASSALKTYGYLRR